MSRMLSGTFGFFGSAQRWKFDPAFDDRVYKADIYSVPLLQAAESRSSRGFRIERRVAPMFEAFGLSPPSNNLWTS